MHSRAVLNGARQSGSTVSLISPLLLVAIVEVLDLGLAFFWVSNEGVALATTVFVGLDRGLALGSSGETVES